MFVLPCSVMVFSYRISGSISVRKKSIERTPCRCMEDASTPRGPSTSRPFAMLEKYFQRAPLRMNKLRVLRTTLMMRATKESDVETWHCHVSPERYRGCPRLLHFLESFSWADSRSLSHTPGEDTMPTQFSLYIAIPAIANTFVKTNILEVRTVRRGNATSLRPVLGSHKHLVHSCPNPPEAGQMLRMTLQSDDSIEKY
jgi:hypothetical protein